MYRLELIKRQRKQFEKSPTSFRANNYGSRDGEAISVISQDNFIKGWIIIGYVEMKFLDCLMIKVNYEIRQ